MAAIQKLIFNVTFNISCIVNVLLKHLLFYDLHNFKLMTFISKQNYFIRFLDMVVKILKEIKVKIY